MSDTLVITEIYLSLQGESPFAGLPCIFIRLTACNLRCSYCDTAYAFTEGKKVAQSDVLTEVHRLSAPFVSGRASTPCAPPAPQPSSSRLPLVELTRREALLHKVH